MEPLRKLPVGVQSFEKLRRDNYLYVDKTRFVWDITRYSNCYFLSRPRRFGKSMFLSTLEAYFEGKRDLFDGLAIQKLEDSSEKAAWQKYPVIYLDFNVGLYNDESALLDKLDTLLQRYEGVYGKTSGTLQYRFESLIENAYDTAKKRVVVLIDEYDKPLIQTMFNNLELNDKYRTILKSFYSVLKSSDKYLEFTFITGITKFSKVSIFSDLNNLDDISMVDRYSDICGITQEELESVFKPDIESLRTKYSYSYEEALSVLKQKYNGYLFSKKGIAVYNPFSLLKTLKYLELENYWFSTGTPTLLVDFLKRSNYSIPKLNGNVEINAINIANYTGGEDGIIPLLFQSGYLTIKSYDHKFDMYTLGFPNNEVRYSFLYCLLPEYMNYGNGQMGYSVTQFTRDIYKGNVDSFMNRMKALISSIPYDSFSGDNATVLREHNYQTAVYLIFALMNEFVHTEVHSSTGRADCVVHTDNIIYIFEFKLASSGSAEDSIAQIISKNYASRYSSSGCEIMAIGASFDESTKTIGEWIKRTL